MARTGTPCMDRGQLRSTLAISGQTRRSQQCHFAQAWQFGAFQCRWPREWVPLVLEECTAPTWEITSDLDIRGANPVSPWGLHNIRGLATLDLELGLIVAGSEDGDLTAVDAIQARIVSKTLYNPSAKRGINALAYSNEFLLVVNCAVGEGYRNIWAYRVGLPRGTITQTDAINLAIDAGAPQIFNFDVAWGDPYQKAQSFFASTEEGVVWMGTCDQSGHLSILGNAPVSRKVGANQLLHLGSGICYSRSRLAVANYDVTQFQIG